VRYTKTLFSWVCARPGSQRNDHNPLYYRGGDEVEEILRPKSRSVRDLSALCTVVA
jgi:hypothetical protein